MTFSVQQMAQSKVKDGKKEKKTNERKVKIFFTTDLNPVDLYNSGAYKAKHVGKSVIIIN